MQRFDDDDDGYLAWLAANQTLFVLNVQRSASPPTNLVLHRATCGTINGTPARRGVHWTGPYIKVCGAMSDLQTYVQGEAASEPRSCGLCMP
jgi:hypothetical protein